MARYGYQALSHTQFVGFHHELTQEPWAALDAGTARNHLTLDDTTGVYYKRLLRDAIDGLVAAQRADNDVQQADAPWDDAERRFVLTVQIKALDADPSVRADALQVQATLCPDGSTAMTNLEAQDEVDFARNQLKLAQVPSLAARIERLGLRALLNDIARCTETLAVATRDGAQGGPRSARIKRAHRRCVVVFNHVHEGLAMLVEQEARPKEKARLTALLNPFTRLLARRQEAADEEEPDAPADDPAHPQGTPAQPVARTG